MSVPDVMSVSPTIIKQRGDAAQALYSNVWKLLYEGTLRRRSGTRYMCRQITVSESQIQCDSFTRLLYDVIR